MITEDHMIKLYIAGFAVLGMLYLAVRARRITQPSMRRLPVYRHKKTGGHYAVLYEGKQEANGRRCVIYAATDQLDNPTPWVRDYDEFHDGRFERIGTIHYDCNTH